MMIMKSKFFTFLLLTVGLLNIQAQDWLAQYKLIHDPADPSAFYVQMVPESVVDGTVTMRSTSIIYLVFPSSLEPLITKEDISGEWGLRWVNLTCNNTRLIEMRMLTQYKPSPALTNGTPVNLIRFKVSGGVCNLGAEGVRFYDNADMETGIDNDPCASFTGAENAITVGSHSAGYVGTPNGSANPLTCPLINVTAADDNLPSTGKIYNTTGGLAGNVLNNDYIDAAKADATNSTLKVLEEATSVNNSTAPTLDINSGDINVAPNTEAATYTIKYELCSNVETSNCKQAIATITVDAEGSLSTINTKKIEIQLYPNPSKDWVTISGLPKKEEGLKYYLYDFSGKLIENKILNEDRRINIEKLPQGTYYINFTVGGIKYNKTFIKN